MFPPLAIGALRFTHVRLVKFHDIERRKKARILFRLYFHYHDQVFKKNNFTLTTLSLIFLETSQQFT